MLKYACVRNVIDVVFSVCIVRRGAVGTRVWEVFRHADVVCLCIVCILRQFSMLRSAGLVAILILVMLGEDERGDHYARGILMTAL